MGLSKCHDCRNMIKAGTTGNDCVEFWACSHPLREPRSCYGEQDGILGYQRDDCPDQDPGDHNRFTFGKDDCRELHEIELEYGSFSPEYLNRGVEIAKERHLLKELQNV